MFYPVDGRSLMIMDSGYHHYIDTGLCDSKSESKFFYINGAVVRLIRFGSSLAKTTTSRIYNITITVDSGELWYLNTSYEIDEFAGALTVIFNNGTYSKFIDDYSRNKIVPKLGKYIIISPKHKGSKLIATDTPGIFTVSGNHIAYCISADGNSAYYSVCSMLKLPEGKHNINYCKGFDISLLPETDEEHEWVDNGFGVVTLVKKEEVNLLYVSANSKDGNGTKEKPFETLEEAIPHFKGSDGIIKIVGEAYYDIATQHSGAVTIMGEDKNAKLMFAKNRHYYLRGDLILKNLILVRPNSSDKFMLETNGHSISYSENVRCKNGMLSGLGQSNERSKAIKINDVFVYSRNIPESIHSKNYCMLFCEEGQGTIEYGKETTAIAKGNTLIIPKSTECKLNFSSVKSARPKLLAVYFTPKSNLVTNKPRLIELSADAFYGDIIEPAFSDTHILGDQMWLAQLSNAVEQISLINESKHDLPRRINEYILQNYATISKVEQLAAEFHLNRSYLERAYKKVYRIGLKKEITKRKCEAAKVLMKKGYSIKEAANAVGYENVSTFSTVFKKTTGHTPRDIAYHITH